MAKVFISGILGQDGAYLAEFLLKKGYQVYGGSRRNSQDELYRLKVLGIENEVKLVPFGEFLPFEKIFGRIGLKSLTNNYKSFSNGESREIISIHEKEIKMK